MKFSQEIVKKKPPLKAKKKTNPNTVQSKKTVVGYMKFNLWGVFLWVSMWRDDASLKNKGAYMERGWMQQRLS